VYKGGLMQGRLLFKTCFLKTKEMFLAHELAKVKSQALMAQNLKLNEWLCSYRFCNFI